MKFISLFIQQCSIRVEVISNFPPLTLINRSFRCSEDNYNCLYLHSIKYVRLLLKKKRPKKGGRGADPFEYILGHDTRTNEHRKNTFFQCHAACK